MSYRRRRFLTVLLFGPSFESDSGGMSEPRLCDYSGQYYCELCHWNDTFKIPARILHNWDFTSYKVCRASKQFLRLMYKKAVIRIQDVNPMLFGYVDQLNEIKKLREEMMIMKKYILSCISAMKAKLLLMLQSRQHFVENSDIYSMQDLLDTEEVLLPELVRVHSSWAQHIKVDCELCQGRGFCCELCQDKEVLFPFDNTAVVCPTCSSVLHRHCFAKKGVCPRCERRSKRKQNKS
ncbi:differentially expressed in FDCP 8 homolog [Elysia marginata]|uniref:Differentially expressed in FDCP 8 homolog n=1 Tax=Elysia marginata TaxID=1093978 RepID=A0AAV4FC14_9GAST|nr:differentially expressed in FDCP 8 homolog [Elysia marginata]